VEATTAAAAARRGIDATEARVGETEKARRVRGCSFLGSTYSGVYAPGPGPSEPRASLRACDSEMKRPARAQQQPPNNS